MAEVYRSVDEDGNVIFSDQPSPGAERIEIRELPTIKAPPLKLPEEASPPLVPPGEAEYSRLEIISPVADTAIRDNAGNVTVSVSIEPELNAGHILVLYLDGIRAQQGTGMQFSLANVNRGSHSLAVAIENGEGGEVMRSSSIAFVLHRESRLDPDITSIEDPDLDPKTKDSLRQMPTVEDATDPTRVKEEGARGFSPRQLPPAKDNPNLPKPPPPPASSP